MIEMPKKVKEISNPPFALQQYIRTLIPKKGNKKGVLPNTLIRKENVIISRGDVLEYAKVCGFKDVQSEVPPVYMHILAFPFQLELLLDKKFPFPIMGNSTY